MADPLYTADRIAAVLARHTFAGALCVVDRCNALGNECDLLVVTRNLRAIDVEIKISRADLKAERSKSKWFEPPPFDWFARSRERPAPTPRDWPQNVWKHYYAVAAPVWRDELLEHCQPKSGVVTVQLRDDGSLHHIDVKRRCTANKADKPLDHGTVVDIARLASLRMWSAYEALGRRSSMRVRAEVEA